MWQRVFSQEDWHVSSRLAGLKTLFELFFGGGLTIETPSGQADGQPIFLRTVVQPDGDVATLMNRRYLQAPSAQQSDEAELIKGHLARVRDRLESLDEAFNVPLKILAGLGVGGGIIGGLAPNLDKLIAQPESLGIVLLQSQTLISVALGALAGPAIAWLGQKLVAWWLKRKIGKLMKSMRRA